MFVSIIKFLSDIIDNVKVMRNDYFQELVILGNREISFYVLLRHFTLILA